MISQNKKDLLKEILRFLIVGGFATLCDYAAYFLFKKIILVAINPSVNTYISTTIGFLVGLLVNWVLQKFVFRYITENQTKSPKVFFKFFLLSLVGLLITQFGMMLGNRFWFDKLYVTIFVKFDFWEIFTKCALTGLVLVINYIGRKLYVFKDTTKEINN